MDQEINNTEQTEQLIYKHLQNNSIFLVEFNQLQRKFYNVQSTELIISTLLISSTTRIAYF